MMYLPLLQQQSAHSDSRGTQQDQESMRDGIVLEQGFTMSC
jgi:hypothetical protein